MPDTESSVDALLVDLGRVVEEQLTAVTTALDDGIRGAIEELPDDDLMAGLLYASIESNIETLVHLLRYDLVVEDAGPPPAAAEYARRLAQRGTSITALIRSYRLGQQLVVDWAFDQLGAGAPAPVALVAARRFSAMTFAYVDAISEGIIGEYQAERERWLAPRSTLRTDLVERLLAGRDVSVAEAEQVLGHRVQQHHVGVVLWVDDGAQGAEGAGAPDFEGALAAVGAGLGARGRALLEPRDTQHAWGWVPVPAECDGLPAPEPNGPADGAVRVALGTPAPGLAGLRSSHAEALQARRVAQVAGAHAGAMTSYADPGVRAAALLGADLDGTRRLVRRALGGLVADTAAAARLRGTLLTFLSGGASYPATAERLHLHRNTVRYRVERALEERGRPLDDERLELELALTACHWLGDAVLGD